MAASTLATQNDTMRLSGDTVVPKARRKTHSDAASTGFDFEIIDMDGHRIDKVLVKISEEIKDEMEEE